MGTHPFNPANFQTALDVLADDGARPSWSGGTALPRCGVSACPLYRADRCTHSRGRTWRSMDDDRRVCPPALRIAGDIGTAARGDVSTAATILAGETGGLMFLEHVGATQQVYRMGDLNAEFEAAHPGVLDGDEVAA